MPNIIKEGKKHTLVLKKYDVYIHEQTYMLKKSITQNKNSKLLEPLMQRIIKLKIRTYFIIFFLTENMKDEVWILILIR